MACNDINKASSTVLGSALPGPMGSSPPGPIRSDSAAKIPPLARQGTSNTPWNQDLSTTASTLNRNFERQNSTPPQAHHQPHIVPGNGHWYEGTYMNRSKDFGFIKSPAFPLRDVYVSDTSIRGLMPKEGQLVKFRVGNETPGSDSTMGNVATECKILDGAASASPSPPNSSPAVGVLTPMGSLMGDSPMDESRWHLGEYVSRKENYGFIRCAHFFGRDIYCADSIIMARRDPAAVPPMPMPHDYNGKMVEFRVQRSGEGNPPQFKAIEIRMAGPGAAVPPRPPMLSHQGSTTSMFHGSTSSFTGSSINPPLPSGRSMATLPSPDGRTPPSSASAMSRERSRSPR